MPHRFLNSNMFLEYEIGKEYRIVYRLFIYKNIKITSSMICDNFKARIQVFPKERHKTVYYFV